ncbi:MAG: Hsp33 family molecular chaperone HslO [Clostridia bacterium]
MKDRIIRAITEDGYLNIFVCSSTNMVEAARKTHDMSPVASAALGRTLTMAAMMGLSLKDDKNKLTITIRGDGPIGAIVVTGDNKGNVKGYVDNPKVESKLRQNRKLDVASVVGKNGRLMVIKDLGLKEPYIGQVELVTGEIAEDFAYYFALSEQQPSAVALGVLVDTDSSIRAAGGVLIQPMPGIPGEVIQKLEKDILKLDSISSLIDQGMSPEDIVQYLFGDYPHKILGSAQPRFICDCSVQRFESVLISLGEKELKEMIEEPEGVELNCHFCGKAYRFSQEDLIRLLANAME